MLFHILLIVLFDCSSSFWLLVLLSFFLYFVLVAYGTLGGGFIFIDFPPTCLLGEMIQFDDHIFQRIEP